MGDNALKDAVYDNDGRIVFHAPDGDLFYMPPGGDVRVYIRKGYTLATNRNPDPPTLPPLRDNDWAGCRCFIIGGGPSLVGFDWKRLDGELTIGINRALEVMTPTVSLSLDSRWLEWTVNGALGEHAARRYAEFSGHKVMVSGDGTQYDPPVQTIAAYPNPNTLTDSMKYGIGHGDNSGFAALNLALCLGASEIYLLGFDMNAETETQQHFHDGYPETQRGSVSKKFIAAFNMVADGAKKRAQIVNCNPNSGLRCFEFGDPPVRMPMPVFVSAYTPGYRSRAETLIASLERFGLDHEVCEIPDAGSWVANCAQKPAFIKGARKRHKGRAVVWVDADAEIKQAPDIFARLNGADFAAHTLEDELLSGTLYFAPTTSATRLLTRWAKRQDANPGTPDQETLADALRRWKGKQTPLPAEYCRIFDSPLQADVLPVIEHFQAGRESQSLEGPVFVDAQLGFGDNLNQRVYVKELARNHSVVYVQTPVPEIYWDIKRLRFVRPDNKLRTQTKNEDRADVTWHEKPKGIVEQSCLHSNEDYKAGLAVPDKFAKNIAMPYDFEFPLKQEWIDAAQEVLDGLKIDGKKVCLIKRPTIRAEWSCASRNPKPEYCQLLVDKYGDEYFFITIHDIEDGEEWFVGELSGVDAEFDKGELPFTTIAGLAKLADMIVCYPSFMMLLGISQRTKTFALFGGLMRPGMVVSDIMGLDEFAFVAPHPFCECQDPRHECDKEIPDWRILQTFDALKKGRDRRHFTLGLPPGIGDLHWMLTKLESFRRVHDIAHLKVVIDEDSGHKSSIAFLRTIPFIDEVEQSPRPFPWVWKTPARERPMIREDVPGLDMLLEINSPLEMGDRLETILPEYEINWRYHIPYEAEDRAYAHNMREVVGGRLVVIYASSNGANEAWAGNWTPRNWERVAVAIKEITGSKVVFVGADWDKNYAAKLMEIDTEDAIHDLVGRTSDVNKVLALIREAELFIGLASGMPIMATHFRTPTIMLWPNVPEKFDRGFQTAWVSPATLRAGEYVNLTYGEDARPDNVTIYAETALRNGGQMREFVR